MILNVLNGHYVKTKIWRILSLCDKCPDWEFFCSEYRKIRTRKNSVFSIFQDFEIYSAPCQITTTKFFQEIVNGFQMLTLCAKSTILDV